MTLRFIEELDVLIGAKNVWMVRVPIDMFVGRALIVSLSLTLISLNTSEQQKYSNSIKYVGPYYLASQVSFALNS